MNGSGEKFFPRARLSGKQDGCGGNFRDPACHFNELTKNRTAPQQTIESVLRLQRGLQAFERLTTAGDFQTARNQELKFFEIDGLSQVVKSPKFHRFDSLLGRSLPRDHKNGIFSILLVNPPQKVNAILLSGQADVYDREVRLVGMKLMPRGAHLPRFDNLIVAILEDFAD
jgi:hypothetical protein